MNLYDRLASLKESISVIGVGYVGLPLTVALAKKFNVVGYDLSEEKIRLYRQGVDVTGEVGSAELKSSRAVFTSDEAHLLDCSFHIVAVPTPIYRDKTPNLTPLKEACRTLGRNLSQGSIVVFESTVYPGVTEDICVPILESMSGLKLGEDFKVGYSPERINPGDHEHRLENIIKVVSGSDNEALACVAQVYGAVVHAGIYKAQSIKVAEAAKVIENAQRDLNIAFMNEISIVFNMMGIDTKQVLAAARTKWNFLDFKPGLVGGHCIGIDPYYLIYKSNELGYHSQLMISGRKINDGMGKYVADNVLKLLIQADRHIKGARVAVLGVTFKENCPDVRNTKVIDIMETLNEFGIETIAVDPVADRDDLKRIYGMETVPLNEVRDVDAVIVAVAHDAFAEHSLEDLKALYADKALILADIKGLYSMKDAKREGYIYWRL